MSETTKSASPAVIMIVDVRFMKSFDPSFGQRKTRAHPKTKIAPKTHTAIHRYCIQCAEISRPMNSEVSAPSTAAAGFTVHAGAPVIGVAPV